jgi:hypothetical protein
MTVAVECLTEVESPAAGEDDHYSISRDEALGQPENILKIVYNSNSN